MDRGRPNTIHDVNVMGESSPWDSYRLQAGNIVVMLCYVMLCYVMLCYVMLCYVMLCYVMLCYVMLCYVMLCYVMLCYVMLCCYVVPCIKAVFRRLRAVLRLSVRIYTDYD